MRVDTGSSGSAGLIEATEASLGDPQCPSRSAEPAYFNVTTNNFN